MEKLAQRTRDELGQIDIIGDVTGRTFRTAR